MRYTFFLSTVMTAYSTKLSSGCPNSPPPLRPGTRPAGSEGVSAREAVVDHVIHRGRHRGGNQGRQQHGKHGALRAGTPGTIIRGPLSHFQVLFLVPTFPQLVRQEIKV